MPLTGGNEILVNQNTAGNQQSSRITVLENGNIVLTWSEYDPAGSDGNLSSVKGRVFSPQGFALTNEFQLNTETDGFQGASQITALVGGGFAVSWTSPVGGTNNYSVRVFNDLGVPVSAETTVNADTVDGRQSSIAALDDGGFVVTFVRNAFDPATLQNTGSDTVAQVFNADGSVRGGNVVLSSENGPAYNEVFAGVSGLSGGGYVAVWAHVSDFSSPDNYLAARIVNASGTPVGPEIVIASGAPGYNWMDVTGLSNGNFVVTWYSFDVGNPGTNISARVYDASGRAVTDEFVVNQTLAGDQLSPRVTATADGGFTIAWNDNGILANGIYNSATDQSGVSVMARSFDALGNPTTGEFRVNIASFGDQDLVDIAALPTGSFAATWTDFQALGQFGGPYDTSIGDIRLRIYADGPNLAPVLGIPLELTAAEGQDFTVTTAQLLSRITDANPGDTLTISDVALDGIPIFPNGDGTYTIPGNIAVNDPVSEQFTLTYSVSDGTNIISAYANVSVTADPAPAISTLGGGDSAAVTVSPGSTLVVDADATDASTQTDTQSWSIVSDPSGLFTIDTATGALSFLDAPTTAQLGSTYTVTISVADSFGGSDTQDITVRVANDVSNRTFTEDDRGTQFFDVLANSPAGTTLTSIDSIMVSTSSTRLETFDVGSFANTSLDNNQIRFDHNSDLLDRLATGETATFTITYTTSLGTTADLTLTYTGVDDLPYPQFSLHQRTENNTSAGKFLLIDPDTEYTGIVFSITGGADADKFTIDPATGVLHFNTRTDFENPVDADGDNIYQVDLAAETGGTVFALESVQIDVQNVNEPGAITLIQETVIAGGSNVNNAVYGGQFSIPSIAALAGGGFVAVYNTAPSYAGTGTPPFGRESGSLYIQFLDDAGAPAGTPTEIMGGQFPTASAVTQLADGAILVTAVTANNGISYQKFATDGTALSAVTTIDRSDPSGNNFSPVGQSFFNFAPSVAALDDGGFIVSWDEDRRDGIAGANAVIRIIGPDGNPAAPDIVLEAGAGYREDSPDVAVLEDGSFVVTWTELKLDESGTSIPFVGSGSVWQQRYSTSGSALGAPVLVDGAASTFAQPNVVALAGGGFAISWTSADAGGVQVLRTFDANGAMLATVDLGVPGIDAALNASLALLPDGSLLVTWSATTSFENPSGLDAFGVTAQIFSPDLTAVTDPFPLNVGQAGLQTWSDVAVSASGAVVGIWFGYFDGPGGVNPSAYSVRTAAYTLSASGNLAPVVSGPVTLPAIAEDSAAIIITSAQLLANASDPNAGDTLAVANLSASSGTLDNNGNGTWTFTPAANDDTAVTFSYNVSDGTAAVATSASLDLTPVNDGPTIISDQGNLTTAEDASFTLDVSGNFADPEGDTLTYSASGLPSWLAINSATGVLSGTPGNDGVGTYNISVSASDGQAMISDAFTLTVTNVNDAPVVSVAADDQTAAEDAAFSYTLPAGTFTDVDAGDTLVLAASGLPGWLSFNAATRTFSGTPENGDVGTVTVTITATDGSGASVSDAFTLTVTNTNDAPIVTAPVTLPSVAEDSSVTVTTAQLLANSSDPDAGDALAVANLFASSGTLVSNGNGTWTFTPAANDDTAVTFSYGVSDGTVTVATFATLDLTPVNDAPIVAAPLANRASPEDTALSFALPAGSFSDVDNAALTLSATLASGAPLPGWLSFNAATHTFSGTPPLNFDGDLDIRVTATDAAGLSASSTFAIDITPLNDAPTDIALSGGTVAENSANGAIIGTATATDPDTGDTRSFALTNNAGGRFAINANTGVISVANGALLNFEAATAHSIVVQVTDSGGASYSEAFTITVANVNEAPTSLTLTSGGTVAENAANGTAVAQLAASDPDAGSVLTYSLSNNAGGRFAINSATGAITVANGSLLDFETATSHAITAVVTDGGSLSRTLNLTIGITDVVETTPSINGTNGSDILLGTVGNDVINGLDGNDVIIAGSGADIVFGGAGRDILYGDAGDDQIIGGAGADILLGGSGRDVFRYASASDAPRATGILAALSRETILDFNPNNGPNHDIIDLSAIDANSALAGNQAFAFIGGNAFSGQAGELRYAGGIVYADVNGDGVADLEIALFVPQSAIDASDFIL